MERLYGFLVLAGAGLATLYVARSTKTKSAVKNSTATAFRDDTKKPMKQASPLVTEPPHPKPRAREFGRR